MIKLHRQPIKDFGFPDLGILRFAARLTSKAIAKSLNRKISNLISDFLM
jgi:hypothetical protein